MVFKLRGRHRLGDFLNDTFSLVPQIWAKALPVSLAALLPGTALWFAAMGSLGSWMRKVGGDFGSLGEDPSLVISGILPMVLLGSLATVALYLGEAFQEAFVVAQAGAALDGRKPGLGELLAPTWRRAWMRVTAQTIVIGSLTATVTFTAVGALFLPLFLSKLGDIVQLGSSGFDGLGLVVPFLAAYFGAIILALALSWWIRVKTAVAAPAAVLGDLNAFSGLGRSLDLVRGRSWRIFGTMFIVELVISFALGIVTGPITFIAIFPGYFSFLRESMSGGSPSSEAILALVSSMRWAVSLILVLSGLVEGTLWPSFLTVLHADLQVRHGEREAFPEDAPALTGLPGTGPQEPSALADPRATELPSAPGPAAPDQGGDQGGDHA